MPRNRYTKLNRKSQRAQIARQEKELAAPAKELHCKDVEATTHPTVVPFVDWAKERRRARLEQKRRRKPEGLGAAGMNQA